MQAVVVTGIVPLEVARRSPPGSAQAPAAWPAARRTSSRLAPASRVVATIPTKWISGIVGRLVEKPLQGVNWREDLDAAKAPTVERTEVGPVTGH
jgi:hypothetical protein